jgi:hypothetical protein
MSEWHRETGGPPVTWRAIGSTIHIGPHGLVTSDGLAEGQRADLAVERFAGIAVRVEAPLQPFFEAHRVSSILSSQGGEARRYVD